MFSGEAIGTLLHALGVSHVVTIPDSTLGRWESGIEGAGVSLIRVCREGEAWAVAGGLYLGGKRPLVMIQCTGLFESGDALRTILHDWKLPIPSIIGYRSYLNQSTLPGDTCLTFTEPVLDAWRIPYLLVTSPDQLGAMQEQLRSAIAEGTAKAVLIAEGKA
jgi:sulfopyruvate decarboxylase TPP-binding subunit